MGLSYLEPVLFHLVMGSREEGELEVELGFRIQDLLMELSAHWCVHLCSKAAGCSGLWPALPLRALAAQ